MSCPEADREFEFRISQDVLGFSWLSGDLRSHLWRASPPGILDIQGGPLRRFFYQTDPISAKFPGWHFAGNDGRQLIIGIGLFAQASWFVGIIAVISDCLFITRRDMGHQQSEPIQSIKGFAGSAVFGCIDYLGRTIWWFFDGDIDHALLREAGADNVFRQFFQTRFIIGPDFATHINMKSAVMPG